MHYVHNHRYRYANANCPTEEAFANHTLTNQIAQIFEISVKRETDVRTISSLRASTLAEGTRNRLTNNKVSILLH